MVSKPIMVNTGQEGEIIVNPQEFVGKITLNVSKQMLTGGSAAGANLNVALIEISDFKDTLSHSQKLAKAAATGITDNTGKVVFNEVASNYSYVAYVYIDANQNTFTNGNFSSIFVAKEGEETFSVTINEADLSNSKVNMEMSVYYYGYKNGDYGTHYISGVNVLAVPYDDYYSYNLEYKSLNYILNYKVAQGVTNSSGNTSIQLKAQKDYKVLVYFDDQRKYWSNGTIYSGIYNSTRSIEVEESYLGLNK
jgi:hypothetical protein